MRLRLTVILAAVTLGAIGSSALAARRHEPAPAPTIQVLSGRSNLVSGGEALIAVAVPHGSKPAALKMTLGRRNVTGAFAIRPNGQYEGLLTGIPNGSNVLRATLPGRPAATTTLVGHPVGGPLFAGPQVQPWACQNGSKDPQCNAPTTYSYEYMSSVTHSFEAYDPSKPPADVATTTTQNGATVPFIVRIETGYQDRDQYQIAVLYQPGKPWEAWAPQPQFNHKLLITHGASCGIEHESGTAPSTTGDTVGVPGGPSASRARRPRSAWASR